MLVNRSLLRPSVLAATFLFGLTGAAVAQSPNCGILQGSQETTLPTHSGTLPGSGDMVIDGGGGYLYVLTQWGFARAPLSNLSNPGPYGEIVVGREGGSDAGIIPIQCDCHQGGLTMDAVDTADGTSRMISDWQPYRQGGPDPSGSSFSGYAAQLADTVGAGSPAFGQQINLAGAVPGASRIAAVYLPASGKYFGYFPVTGAGVSMADLTSPTGSPSAYGAIQPTTAIGWASGTGTSPGVRLRAGHAAVPGYDKYLLVGATYADLTLHVAEIDGFSGVPTEVASAPLQPVGNAVFASQLEIAVVNNRIFLFAAQLAGGLQVYEFQPPNAVLFAGSIAGTMKRVAVRGPAPFPALFVHRSVSASESYIDIYDTKWLTQGGSPLLAKSLQHVGASYSGTGFEALVTQVGAVLTAYLYRERAGYPAGVMHTDKIDVSCIAADPTAPPIPYATMINLSSQARGDGINYYGDKWQIQDSSVSYQPITEVDWDFHNTGAFVAEKIAAPPGAFSDINPAWWPCDMASGGDIQTGAGCYASLGNPAATYQLGLNSVNINGPGSPPFISSPIAVVAPQISIIGYNASTQTLQVLSGGTANATGSQGNTADAAFAWTFTPGGTATGLNPVVPSTATSFSLTATYKGGYVNTTSGAVQQVDLVPNFSITSPLPALVNSTVTIKNTMQIGGGTTLDSVTFAIAPSYSGSSGTLPASFNAVNGTAGVPAAPTAGSYTITLAYNFSGPHGGGQQSTASASFSTTVWSPNPIVGAWTNSNHTGYVPVFGNTYSLTQGTTYYLFDDEALPNGVTHPGASFYKSTNSNPSTSGDTLIGSSTGYGPVTFSASTVCASSCYFKVSVSGVVSAFAYTVSSGGCTVNCGGSPTLSLSGPAVGVTGQPVTFTAVPANFTPTSYTWDFGDTAGGGGCPPIIPTCTGPTTGGLETATPGPNPNTYPGYVNVGTHTVTVTASNGSTTRTASRTITISVGGPPVPSGGYTVTGATQNVFNNTWEVEAGRAVTLSATEVDANVSATEPFTWTFSDGGAASGRTVMHAFASPGAATATLTVTGDGVNRVGTATASIRFGILTPSFRAVMIPSAGSIDSPAGVWATDLSVTNPGTQPTTITLYFAAYTDTIPSDLSTLPFNSLFSFTLNALQSASLVDVVGSPPPPCTSNACGLGQHGAGKGILLLKYDGGDQAPIATARVYFTAQGASFGTALPSFLVGPYGPIGPQEAELVSDQFLIGLRNDSLYRFNVSLFNAASQSGLFHVDAYTEDGEPAGSKDFGVPPYSQAGVNDTDIITSIDPSKRYILKARVVGTTGVLHAYASELDRRNNDLVQVADDTPRVSAAPGTPVDYYIAGVGRIEDASTNAHWRTDLRFFNGSTLPRDLTLEFRYTPPEGSEQRVLAGLHIGAGQGISIDDIVGNFLDDATPADLKTGTALGLLKVSYNAPTDAATAPLIIGGRIYADLPTGTAGMQLSTYTGAQSVAAGAGSLVMPGAQTNLQFRTNIGVFTLGDLPTTAHISAIKQDGTVASAYEYVLNNPGQTGAFVQIPMGALSNIDGNPMTIKIESLSGSPVGAYLVTVDQISADTIFIQGRPTP